MTKQYDDPVVYDPDPPETQEWRSAIDSVFEVEGEDRARFLISQLIHYAREKGIEPPVSPATAYENTLSASDDSELPDSEAVLNRLIAALRWNAIAMVLHAGKVAPEVGGHIASYASSAVLYEVGFNYFFKGHTDEQLGDLVFIQGHSAPGIYARAFLENRLSAEQLNGFRQEVEQPGVSSYPHPWLMPDFWEFPTVSMGLGPLQAIYQARFMKYLNNRGIGEHDNRYVWLFAGDGEMDEPESAGALHIACKERLDNLIFVVNCNLQRLDGPVRGSGKLIQEYESLYRGAGWNVIKVLWNRQWDKLFQRDSQGRLTAALQACYDGDLQRYKANGPAYFREHFFNRDPELKKLIEGWSDDDIAALEYGGHDWVKVYSAYKEATALKNGRPTVILAQTVKGFGMGEAGEAQNITHQQKKMDEASLKAFRDRFNLPLTDQQVANLDYYRPEDDSEPMRLLNKRREALGGYVPRRPQYHKKLAIPALDAFKKALEGSGDRDISTTMAFVRILSTLLRDKNIKDRIVPIVPDESRTFGMEGMFRQLGIYSVQGQLFQSHDQKQIMAYREAKDGQYLEEGITEAGAHASWVAAATAYNVSNEPMIPFYVYYSMFGYQRTGDLAWAAGDIRARGFLIGGTAGRTTLAGEGLQHQDGHNQVCFSMLPTCRAYDPVFIYELAVIMQHGLKAMYEHHEDVFYYLSVTNENYYHPPMPKGVEQGIIKGLYHYQKASGQAKRRVQLLGSGTIFNEVLEAARLLKDDFNVHADVWSVTSFSELRKDGMAVERANRLHPDHADQVPYVTERLKGQPGPVVAASDYVRLYADLIRPYVPQTYYALGTDGYGRSDTRAELRQFFEINARWIAYTALKALVDDQQLESSVLKTAIKNYNLDTESPDPWTV